MSIDKAGAYQLRESLRTFVPLLPTEGGKITVKPFDAGQAWKPMLGYVQKDAGQDHFQLFTHNVSEDDLKAAREEYNNVRMSYDEGRKLITKNSLVNLAFRFWAKHLRPLRGQFRLDHVLRLMLVSREYVPAVQWICTRQGVGMPCDAAQSLWEIVTADACSDIPLSTVQDVFYDPHSLHGLRLPEAQGYDRIQLEDARELARQLREGELTQRQLDDDRAQQFGNPHAVPSLPESESIADMSECPDRPSSSPPRRPGQYVPVRDRTDPGGG